MKFLETEMLEMLKAVVRVLDDLPDIGQEVTPEDDLAIHACRRNLDRVIAKAEAFKVEEIAVPR